jgi:YidC/Oxa1 family membrane protein insertase
MTNILYTFIIFPIEQLIELCYTFTFRLTKSPGLSIIVLSMTVSTLILPIYLMAEEKQKNSREKQERMKWKIDKIKAVFKGDERYMLTSTLYRQNNYHPIYALSNSLDLFIQIPFFIAAYHFLHSLESLNGQKFSFIADLGAPDGLLWGVNLFPIIMTVINCVSGAIYSKGLHLKDKITLYGIALVFFVLLYNSPSALVLYWTCNNIYNLVKNIVLKNEKLKRIIYPTIIILICLFILYILLPRLLLSHYEIGKYKRFAIGFSIVLIFLIKYRKKIIVLLNKIINNDEKNEIFEKQFFITLLGLVLLTGLVIPSKLIASSVVEFSYLKPNTSPLPFIFSTFIQSAGIAFWLICIFYLFKPSIIKPISIIITIVSFISLTNTLFFSNNYGIMSPDLNFRVFVTAPVKLMILNMLIFLFLCIFFIFIFKYKKTKILFTVQCAISISILFSGIIYVYKINNQFNKIDITPTPSITSIEKVYSLSKTEKNLLIIVADRAMSLFFPVIINEKPELKKSFSGFIYYPNTLSAGRFTIYGMPSIFGGYYYTPFEINKRPNETLYNKYIEAQQVLPRIMSNSGFNVYLSSNQNAINDTIHAIKEENYDDDDNIKVIKYKNYYDYFIANNPDFILKDYKDILYHNLIRYSFFECSSVIFHKILYDKGDYLSLQTSSRKINSYQKETISNYSELYYLPESTKIIDSNTNQAVIVINNLNIYDAIFSMSDYYPSNYPVIDNNQYSSDSIYHTNMAVIFLISKYLDFLKENNVYNNTRIIIVSDHGRLYTAPLQSNIIFNNYFTLADVNALLMVKDFDAEFELRTNNSFMTNADVPIIATQELVQNPVNPFTGNQLPVNKDSGFIVTSSLKHDLEEHLTNSYNIKPDEWFLVKDNIFEQKNWSKLSYNK